MVGRFTHHAARILAALLFVGATWQGFCGVLCGFKVCPSDILSTQSERGATEHDCCAGSAAEQAPPTDTKGCCAQFAKIKHLSHFEAASTKNFGWSLAWVVVAFPAVWDVPQRADPAEKALPDWTDDPHPSDSFLVVTPARGPPVST